MLLQINVVHHHHVVTKQTKKIFELPQLLWLARSASFLTKKKKGLKTIDNPPQIIPTDCKWINTLFLPLLSECFIQWLLLYKKFKSL
jgi:hypothetical protein